MKRLAWMIGCAALLAPAFAQSPAPRPAPAKPEPAKPEPAKPEPAKPEPAKPAAEPRIPYPDWLFPVDDETLRAAKRPPPKEPKEPPKLDDVELLTIPDSDQKYTLARINDQFNAPDWNPAGHGPMPDIVAKGRKPKVIACAFCHTPTGQGRPENSALAGLPEAYIKEQLEAFRDGKRPAIGPEVYAPSRGMQAVAAALTDKEIDESAKYFAQQKLARRHYVVEGINIPRAEPASWVYKEVDGTEDLGERLVEVAPDITRHERRDPKMQYTVYAPPGSLMRGKSLATTGDKGKTQICATCHLAKLEGTDKIPPIAGRSPTYLLRQLIAFKNGARTNEAAKQMDAVVEKLELEDMVALAAYVGSLYPPK